jgi:hypothetical protein
MKLLTQRIDIMRTTEKQRTERHLKRLWGDVEVIDAMKDLRVMILPIDLKIAKRKDPTCCVFAQACRRSFGSTRLLFYRSCAYVELPNNHGKIRVERFTMDTSMRELIAAFDRGCKVLPKAGFVLKAPPPSRRLDVQSKMARDNRKRRKSDRKLFYPKRPELRKPVVADLQIRSGNGAVHFTFSPK